MNRTIAVVGALSVLAAIYFMLIEPLGDKRLEMQNQINTDYTTLIKYTRYKRFEGRSEERLERSEKRLRILEALISPQSDTSVAFANLQGKVQSIATQSGLTVTSIKPLPTEQFKNYTGLPIFMDCTGNINDVSVFLKQLDSPNTMLDIDRLNISVQRDGQLRIKIQVTGLMVSS